MASVSLIFFWGLAKFIFRVGGDENAVETGRRLMIWGVIALFVMMAIWGITSFIERNLLPGESFTPPPVPTIGI